MPIPRFPRYLRRASEYAAGTATISVMSTTASPVSRLTCIQR